MLKWLLICLAVLAGCNSSPPPWDELLAGETAKVYTCGGWPTTQIGQIQLAVADINATVRHENGKPFLAYEGERSVLFGESADQEMRDGGGRCIWWIHDAYPTPEGRALWDKAQANGWQGVYDGDAVYGFMPTAPPPGQFTVWLVQGLVAHELGHAIGADHISVDDGERAVMDPHHLNQRMTAVDIDELCSHEVSCDAGFSVAAKSRL